jgi:colanic acid/amylovoran biosynthesis glycosyltransferase
MKIAFIVSYFPALSETFILRQITGLLDLGHDVEIFALNNAHEKKVHFEIQRYGLKERVNYFFDNNVESTRVKRILKAAYSIVANFRKGPVKILKALNIFKYGENALSLLLFNATVCFLDKKFDIIHCHFGPNGIIGAQLRDIGISGKLITTFYGSDLTSFIHNNRKDIYKKLFINGDIFLPICNYFKKILLGLGCDKKKIIIHHLGADIQNFPFTPKSINNREVIKFLTISRLVEKKGVEYTLFALSRLLEEHKKIKYLIAGDGPLRDQLEKLSIELNLAEYVEFMGAVNDEEVKTLLQEAHVFVLPSITAQDGEQEGTPTVLVEAQACGLPVISTFHSGIPEMIVDGSSGFLVPEKNIDALAEKIEYFIDHPEAMLEMGSYGRKLVDDNFNVRKLNQKLVDIYSQLVGYG